MGYGLGAFLLAVGLLTALAVDNTGGVDVTRVGWVVFAAGAVVLLVTWAADSSHRRP